MSSASMSFLSFSLSTSTTSGVFGLRAFAHRLALQHHAFGLDGFHEIHEGIRCRPR